MIWLTNTVWTKCTLSWGSCAPYLLVPHKHIQFTDYFKARIQYYSIFSSMVQTVPKCFTRYLCRSHLSVPERPCHHQVERTHCALQQYWWKRSFSFTANAWEPSCSNRNAELTSCNITVLSSTAWRRSVAPSQKECSLLSHLSFLMLRHSLSLDVFCLTDYFVPWKVLLYWKIMMK